MTGQPHLRALLHAGDHAGFIAALEPLIQHTVDHTAPNGLEREDLAQEARTAALKAARTWTPDRGTNPLTWAVLIIRRETQRAAAQQLTQNRKANIDTLSLQWREKFAGGPGAELQDTLPAASGDPCQDLIDTERLHTLEQRIQQLPPAQRHAVDLYIHPWVNRPGGPKRKAAASAHIRKAREALADLRDAA